MWQAEPAAERMLAALDRRVVEFTFTGHGRVGVFLGRHFPGLLQWAAPRLAPSRRKDQPGTERADG
jgi:hypothetical protein